MLAQKYAWTDSTIVLSWLNGNPRRFNTYVANVVSYIAELIAPDCWNHVCETDNPANCASRGLFPVELLEYQLWWNGPNWLTEPPTAWPHQSDHPHIETTEERECTLHTVTQYNHFYRSLLQLYKVETYHSLDLSFVNNCCANKNGCSLQSSSSLTTKELHTAEVYWISIAQEDCFPEEIEAIKKVKSYVALVLGCPSTQSLTHLTFYVCVAETASRRCHTQSASSHPLWETMV